jgi:hypothetical protein
MRPEEEQEHREFEPGPLRLGGYQGAVAFAQPPRIVGRRPLIRDAVHNSSLSHVMRRRSEPRQMQEDLTRCTLPPACRQGGVDHGVLDVAVAKPVLDEAQLGASL